MRCCRVENVPENPFALCKSRAKEAAALASDLTGISHFRPHGGDNSSCDSKVVVTEDIGEAYTVLTTPLRKHLLLSSPLDSSKESQPEIVVYPKSRSLLIMTLLALDNAVSSALKSGIMFPMEKPSRSSDARGSQSRPLPTRITLRKRSSDSKFHHMNLGSVNSAFLSGLFADVAQASTLEEAEHPSKKARVSHTKSLARCGRSYKQLVSIGEALSKASQLTESCVASPVGATTSFFAKRQDSLHYQLDCVSSSSCSATDASSGSTGAKLAFPDLPKTVSNNSSSCDKQLTRVVSDLQSSVSENKVQKNESYGWFVEMEDDKANEISSGAAVDPYASTAAQGLAFQAYTAPKADNHDAEVEWAKAADTVDDVLGDFF